MSFTVVVGSPTPRSHLRAAARHAAAALATRAGIEPPAATIDLADLGPALITGGARGDVGTAVDRLTHSELLLVATPQIHGTYSGLLKVFLDHLPQLGLAHTVAVPMAVVPHLRAGHGIEDDLRLLLSDLGAWVAEPGLLLAENEIDAPNGVVDAWAEVAASHVREALSVRV